MAAETLARPGTKAQTKFVRMSASKARVVLNLIRGKRVADALEILEFTERLAADPITKTLNSAVANAEHNEDLDADDLFVSACFADKGPTLRRYRPRARGRAGRIQKQTCHITVEVARLTEEELDELRRRADLKDEGRQSRKKSSGGGDRAKRVAKSKAAAADAPEDEVEAEDQIEDANSEAEEVAETDEATAEVEDTADADSEDATSSDEEPSDDGAAGEDEEEEQA